ncbi:MAG: phage major capsid protein, partial [Dehalococcoidales bacterium]|nr:phage major capsid protein [Dehalococcoidales bacterium]
MAVFGVDAAVELLKDYLLPAYRYQANDQSDILLAQFERDSQSVEGRQIVMALRFGRSGGTGNRADTVDDTGLPTANARKGKQAKWETKNLVGVMHLTDKLMKAAKTSAGAFANLLQAETEALSTDTKDMMSRQVYGDGTGKLATITAAAWAANVLTLTVDDVRYFAEGMFLDVIDLSAAPDAPLANGTGLEVTLVDDVANQVQLTAAVDISAAIQVANDYLVQSGNLNLELTGLASVFTLDSSLYGIDRSLNKWLNPNQIAVNAAISEVLIQKGIDKAWRRAGNRINLLSTDDGTARAYQNLLSAQKQIVNSLELKGGWKALAYVSRDGEVPLTVGKYAPAGKIRLLSSENWKLYQMEDWDWLDQSGSIFRPVGLGYKA